jgi:hypothetical protein
MLTKVHKAAKYKQSVMMASKTEKKRETKKESLFRFVLTYYMRHINLNLFGP